MAQVQRDEFKRQREKVGHGECVIVFDYKQNVKIGTGPWQVSQEYYKQTQQSVFGCVVFSKDQDKKEREQVFHFVSDVLSHDGLFACDCLKLLMNQSYLKQFNSISFWSDCGPHFRNGELVHDLC